MSKFILSPVELAMDPRLTKNELRIMLALLKFKNKGSDLVYPRRESLAEITSLPLCKISTITTALVKKGWLEKVGKGGFSKSCKYRILTPELTTQTVTEPVTVTESETVTETVTKTVTEPVTITVTETVTGKEQTIEQTNEQTINHDAQADAQEILNDGFDDFWQAYPLKKSKAKAQAAWKKLSPSRDLLGLITKNISDRLEAGEWLLTQKQFIPHATTYLNQKRWEDEVVERTPKFSGCDYTQSVIDLYNQKLPGLQPAGFVTQDRASAVRQCEAQREDLGGLEFWAQFFDYVSRLEFLTGGANGWAPNFDWLTNPEKFVRVIEGSYDGGQAA